LPMRFGLLPSGESRPGWASSVRLTTATTSVGFTTWISSLPVEQRGYDQACGIGNGVVLRCSFSRRVPRKHERLSTSRKQLPSAQVKFE
jgi:hypothetical protein